MGGVRGRGSVARLAAVVVCDGSPSRITQRHLLYDCEADRAGGVAVVGAGVCCDG